MRSHRSSLGGRAARPDPIGLFDSPQRRGLVTETAKALSVGNTRSKARPVSSGRAFVIWPKLSEFLHLGLKQKPSRQESTGPTCAREPRFFLGQASRHGGSDLGTVSAGPTEPTRRRMHDPNRGPLLYSLFGFVFLLFMVGS